MKPITLTELSALWRAAKRAEQEATAERLRIEDQMLTLLPRQQEGTVTDDESGVSATFKVTRTLDSAALRRDWNSLPTAVQACVKWAASLDTSTYRNVIANDQVAAGVLPNYLTSKPAKPSINVKEK